MASASFKRKALRSCLLVCAITSSARSQTISLVTVGPGTAPNAWFGHSALLVESDGRASMYSYGVIERRVRSVIGAAFGRVRARATVVPAAEEFARWRRSGRTAEVARLIIDTSAARRLAARLDLDARLPVIYTYDALTDNCSTRIRDVIDAATEGRVRQSLSASAPFTIREAARAAAREHGVIRIIADVMIGSNADIATTYWAVAAVPGGLAAALAHASLIEPSRIIAVSDAGQAVGGALLVGMAIAFVLVAVGYTLRNQSEAGLRAAGTLSVLGGFGFGVPGAVIAWASIVGEHTTLAANVNILLANPLALVAVPVGVLCMRGHARAAAMLRTLWFVATIVAAGGALMARATGFAQDNAAFVAMVLPILCALAAVHAVLCPVVRRVPPVRGVFPQPLSRPE